MTKPKANWRLQTRAGDLLREKEEHQQAVKDWDLACKEREEKLALREKELGSREEKAKVREDKLASQEGTAEALEKREAEAARLVNAATQECEALEVRGNELTTAERSHRDAVKNFQALQNAAEEEREKEVLAQVDLECRQLLVAAAVHVFSQLLRIDATFKLDRLLDDVPADVADDLAERVRKDAESFAETFGPEKTGEERRPAGPYGGPAV